MRYIADTVPHIDESPWDYRVEDGVLIDRTEGVRPTSRAANEATFLPRITETHWEEEERWASLAGPVTARRLA